MYQQLTVKTWNLSLKSHRRDLKWEVEETDPSSEISALQSLINIPYGKEEAHS